MNEVIAFDVELFQLISSEQAWHYGIVPKHVGSSYIEFYVSTTKNGNLIKEELEVLLGKRIEFYPIDENEIHQTLSKYYRKTNQENTEQQTWTAKLEYEDDFLEKIIRESKDLGSSDIHIEPYEQHSRIRIRIDGLMVERYKIENEDFPALVNKVKIKANLDISEKRLPQDGRIHYEMNGSKFDIRVSCLPTLYGEKIVMRLLNNDASQIDIQKLGFGSEGLKVYLEGIQRPNGIVLISGPTGSGKTTTLYASLRLLNKETHNILTIEDPIEYTLEGVNQVQLKESIGLNFASALKTFLRQDPDIIMVGEIRDKATASIAIRAALTGHLVLSTIHTNSAWGIVSRLIDMGIPPFLIADTLNIAVAQRLLRLLCSHCKKESPFEVNMYPSSFKTEVFLKSHAVAVGCEYCHFTGYKGRTAIYEIIPILPSIAESIKQSTHNLSQIKALYSYKSLSENAFKLFAQQKTSLEEVYSLLITY